MEFGTSTYRLFFFFSFFVSYFRLASRNLASDKVFKVYSTGLICFSLLCFCFPDSSAVMKFLQHSPKMVNVPKADGFTALHIAAGNNHWTVVKLIVEKVSIFFL